MTDYTKRPLEPGSILFSSWGYDQTNVEFYRVEKITGAFVTLQQIESVEHSDDEAAGYSTMTGKVVPVDPPAPIGNKTFRRKLHQGQAEPFVQIESYSYAYAWDGRPRRVSHYA
jgi:hypothetical protein